MALTTAEVARLRYETGYNILTVGAEPYISIPSLFDHIVVPNLPSGAATTSSTAVTAASTPTLVTITLASATGFTTGDRVWVGVDANLESATAQSLSGAALALSLTKAHSGTYQVYVDSGEAIVRELMAKIDAVKTQLGTVFGTGALKKVDEIEWYQTGSKTQFGLLGDQLMFWRNELCSALNIANNWLRRQSAGSSIAVY